MLNETKIGINKETNETIKYTKYTNINLNTNLPQVTLSAFLAINPILKTHLPKFQKSPAAIPTYS